MALHEDRGAFFTSVQADMAFVSRFIGEPREEPPPGQDLFGGVDRLRAERERFDQRIRPWAATRSHEWPAQPLSCVSKVDRQE